MTDATQIPADPAIPAVGAAPFVRDDVRAFLNFLEAQAQPKMWEVSLAEARGAFDMLAQIAEPPVGELAVMRDLTAPGPAGPIPVRLFDARAQRDDGPVVLFIHGGGFVIGNVPAYSSFCAHIARTLDLPVVSVEYRLAPEAPFPAAPDDCEAAARWVASSPPELGLSVSGLVIAGDSAGGNLTIVTTRALMDHPAAAPVIAQWPIYPVVDSTRAYASMDSFSKGYLLERETMAWFTQNYAADPNSLRVSPLNGNHAGMPPTLVSVASLDPLHDQGVAYAKALEAAGVSVQLITAEDTIHGHITLRQAVPSAQADVDTALAVLQAIIAKAVPAHD